MNNNKKTMHSLFSGPSQEYNTGLVTKQIKGIPIAHRQHLHSGHCKGIHGHTWDFDLNFSSSSYDSRGFIIDFGGMDYPKELFNSLDHAILVSLKDDHLNRLISSDDPKIRDMFKPIQLPSPSAEGMAWWLYNAINTWVMLASDDRVILHSIKVTEDNKNSITFDRYAAAAYDRYVRDDFGPEFLSNWQVMIHQTIADFVAKKGGPYL